ncbi:MAG: hypothetical protein AB2A00_33770 [Myxococcota bacterium]
MRWVAVVALVSSGMTAHARVGFGDPGETFREHKPGELFSLKGHLRVRGAVYNGMDLEARPSPSGQTYWPRGDGPLRTTTGADMRLRLSPTLWFGEDVRVFVEVDVLDNLAFGATPRGTPYNGRAAIVAGTGFQDPVTAAQGAFKLRSAVAEAMTPLGVISAGRSPTHFGLGIAANAGDDLDDDGGDRADRVAWWMPMVGHFLAAAFDIAASGPRGNHNAVGPNPTSPLLGQQAFSLAVLRWRAPWEVDMHRRAGGWVLDYGAALTTQFQLRDNPVYYQTLSATPGLNKNETVRRDYFAALADVWVRFWFRDLRVEAEGVFTHLHIGNPSPYPGVEFRQPVTGNPFAGVLVAEWLPLRGRFGLLGEAGVASPDPSPGFPASESTGLLESRRGDIFGPQVDGVRDRRFDSFRMHPMYRVDLILWRTLLGGVSEAAYARGRFALQPVEGMRFEFNTVYSHALLARSAPGGANPLGFEVDSAMTLQMGSFSIRTDAGVLFPLAGLAKRSANSSNLPTTMVLVRLGYAR